MALHEGFRYQPDENLFWKQSPGNENSYLFVTTRHLNGTYLDSIKDTMQEDSLKYWIPLCPKLTYPKIENWKKNSVILLRCILLCTDFERNFPSLTFALATGVGKARLMGAFITYLYTVHGIRNFFVVALGTTIYGKLQKDLGDLSSSKYVFKGVGCFLNPPNIVTDEDYHDKNLRLWESDINIYIYNIDTFNKEDAKMKEVTENLGKSLYDEISSLDDLVLIMDESRHYRAAKGMAALDNLHPMLGLELTATPL